MSRIGFVADLGYFLRPSKPDGEVLYPVQRRAAVKDVLEALGVPHTEIGALLINGRQGRFSTILRPGDRVLVLPVLAPLDVTRESRLHPVALDRLRFMVDVNVGKLARLLRLLGFDAALGQGQDDAWLVEQVNREQRVLLTRDSGLLKRRAVVWGRHLRAESPLAQLQEVVNFFGLWPGITPFSRCLRCNALLEDVAKAKIADRLWPKTRRYYQEFSYCPDCGRIYWAGSHRAGMLRWIAGLSRPRYFPARAGPAQGR